VPYWDEINKSYLTPIVAQLSGEENPSAGFISRALFSLVVFGASDEFGGALNSIKTSSPTFSPYEFLHYFDSIRFSNGGIDNGTPLSDAISVALVSLQATSEIPNKKKHIVLFTNTEYYSTPVQLFNKFNNSSLSDLMQTIKQESINFSIIAPRKMYALKKIFVEATGLQTSHLGIDQAHMILLMNLGLPENKIEDTKPIPESIQTPNAQAKQINQQAVDDSQNQQQQDYQNNSQRCKTIINYNKDNSKGNQYNTTHSYSNNQVNKFLTNKILQNKMMPIFKRYGMVN